MRSKLMTITKSEISITSLPPADLQVKIRSVEETCFQQVIENMRLREALYQAQNENYNLRRQFDIIEKNYERTEYLLRSLQGQMATFKKTIFKWFSLQSETEKSDDEKIIKNFLKQMMLDEVDSE